jgi:hypothetical protein
MDLDLAPAPGRHLIRLSDRWHVVALEPIDGVLVLGIFLPGELVQVIDEPAGEG